jgi:tRNA G26 N,N-dimethylase Trm1
LGKAGEVLGLPTDQKKDKDGRTLMMKMAKPRNYTATGEPIWWDDLEDHKMLDDLVDYCKQDVLAEIAISKMLTEVSKFTNRQTITYYARD